MCPADTCTYSLITVVLLHLWSPSEKALEKVASKFDDIQSAVLSRHTTVEIKVLEEPKVQGLFFVGSNGWGVSCDLEVAKAKSLFLDIRRLKGLAEDLEMFPKRDIQEDEED